MVDRREVDAEARIEDAPDGSAEPGDYQRYLVGLVEGRDPAILQATTADAWRMILTADIDRLRTKPAPTEWSALECLGHAVDAEIVMAGRYRWALAEDRPEMPGYDQDRWVDALGHHDDDPRDLLALFEALRLANLALWEATSDADRERPVMHRERGPESFRLMFTMLAGHDRFHLAQARRAVEAATSPGPLDPSIRGEAARSKGP